MTWLLLVPAFLVLVFAVALALALALALGWAAKRGDEDAAARRRDREWR
jgi:hypothetical protein